MSGCAAAWLTTPPVLGCAKSEALATSERSLKWIAFYGQTADEAVLASYQLAILDPWFEGSIPAVAASGARVCAYVSIGEILASNSFFDRVARAAILEENAAWPGTHRIDVRHPSWTATVLDVMIPFIVAKGFTGLMLDTLDTPPYLEQLDPVRNGGMRRAAIDLVNAIRRRQPAMTLIMNRGYALLPDVVQSLDAVIAESLLTTPEGDNGELAWIKPDQVALQLALLSPAANRRPPVPILSLDYWDPTDTSTIKEIYRRERKLGHHPYVATRLLNQIVPEPVT